MEFEFFRLLNTGKEKLKIYLILISIILIAIIQDIRNYRISNVLIVIGWTISFLFCLIHDGLGGSLEWFLGAFIPIAGLMILFHLRMMGAGDIKLLSVLGGFLGVSSILKIIIISFLIGAGMAFFKMLYHKNFFIRMQYLANYAKRLVLGKLDHYYNFSEVKKDECIHFSIAIGIGTGVFFIM